MLAIHSAASAHSPVSPTSLPSMPSKTAKLAKLDFKEKLIQSGKGGGQEALLKRLKVRSSGHRVR